MIADVVWVHNLAHRLLCQFEFDERSGFHRARERVTTLAPACWAPKHHLDVLADLAHRIDERLGHVVAVGRSHHHDVDVVGKGTVGSEVTGRP